MPTSKDKFRGRTDREQAIDWLKADLRYYQNNIGEITKYGTLIDEKLINAVKSRIQVLECKDHIQKECDRSPICSHVESDYIGVLYLTLPLSAWGEVGMKFYSHKETGLDAFPTQEEIQKYNIRYTNTHKTTIKNNNIK